MKKWLTPALVAGAFAILTVAESRRPLRRSVDSKGRRFVRNGVMGGLTALVTAALQEPLVNPILRRTTEGRLGLLHRMALPRPARFIAGVLLLDYTLWW